MSRLTNGYFGFGFCQVFWRELALRAIRSMYNCVLLAELLPSIILSLMLGQKMHLFRIAICLVAVSITLPSIAVGQDEEISFVKDVAPIISAKCGTCHVTASRGRYNIKSYQALMDSDTVTAKKPEDSLFIELIENGEMPKGGKKVSKKELETLKNWISAGAVFDGEDEEKSDMIKSAGGRNSRGRSRSRSRSGRGQSDGAQPNTPPVSGIAPGISESGGRTTGRRPSRRRRGRSSSKPNPIQTNKLLAFFDKDGDGKLSLSEIDAASRLLYSLDRNEDDRVTPDELEEFADK